MSNIVQLFTNKAVKTRWIAKCYYRNEGTEDLSLQVHDIEEIFELHDKIERGPDWKTLDRVEIYLRENVE